MISIRKRSNLAAEILYFTLFHISLCYFKLCHRFHTHTWPVFAVSTGVDGAQATCGKYASSMTVNGKPVTSGDLETLETLERH